MFYKVALYTELANTELLLTGEIEGHIPASLWAHFHQLVNITLF